MWHTAGKIPFLALANVQQLKFLGKNSFVKSKQMIRIVSFLVPVLLLLPAFFASCILGSVFCLLFPSCFLVAWSLHGPIPREYWMIDRGTGLFAVVCFGSSPTPPSLAGAICLFFSLYVCRRSGLLTGEGVGVEPNHATVRNFHL